MHYIDVYTNVTAAYDSGRYTQKDISEMFGISLKAVAFCTRYYGYHHTKARCGKKPIFYLKDLEEGLLPLL